MKDNCDINKCLLCYDAPCKKACPNIKPDRVIRSIKFNNEKVCKSLIKKDNPCNGCSEPCKKACPLNINIKEIISDVCNNDFKIDKGINISSNICGKKLENPFLLSSSVVGSNYDMCRRAFKAGWAGIVFKTICLMDIYEASPRFSAIKSSDNTFLGFKNIEQLSEKSLEENLEVFRKLKNEFPDKILIASIMGRNKGEWEYLARKVTQAGVDLIELNFSCPNMEFKGTGSDVGQVPNLVYKYTKAAKNGTNLPLIAKMTPNVTDITIPARAAKRAGAQGISAINTIKSITGVNLESFVPEPCVNDKTSVGGYSGRAVKPIALRFISDLSNNRYLKGIDISGIGGIYTAQDAIEFMLLGCSNVQITTAVMEYGYRIIDDLILGLKIFMSEKNYKKTNEFIGLSKKKIVDANKLDRNTILFPKFNYEKCVGCGRCYISCMDGGHQAIIFDEKERKPKIDPSKCVGCHLCKLVCPQKAIGNAAKRFNIKQ